MGNDLQIRRFQSFLNEINIPPDPPPVLLPSHDRDESSYNQLSFARYLRGCRCSSLIMDEDDDEAELNDKLKNLHVSDESFRSQSEITPPFNLREVALPISAQDTFENFEIHGSTKGSTSHFPDALNLKMKLRSRLDILDCPDCYLDNSVVSSQIYDMMFIALDNDIYVFQPLKSAMDSTWKSILHFSVCSTTTSCPYVTNITIQTMLGEEYLGIVNSNNFVKLYRTRDIEKRITTTSDVPVSAHRIINSYACQDIDMYQDMVAVAHENIVTVYYYIDGACEVVTSPNLEYDINSVAFIRDLDGGDFVYLVTSSVNSVIYVLKFPRVPKVIDPTILDSSVLNEYCSLVSPVSGKSFKKVHSLPLLTGDFKFESQDKFITKVQRESTILDAESDPCTSSHLGLAAELQTLFVPTHFTDTVPESSQILNIPMTPYSLRKDQLINLYKDYCESNGKTKSYRSHNLKSYWKPVASSPGLSDSFFIVSEDYQISLHRLNHMICNSFAPVVFNYVDDSPEHRRYKNSLSFVIPDLSCYIVGNTMGYVSIFRLTEFRGLHGMRQEYIIPTQKERKRYHIREHDSLLGASYKRLNDNIFLLYLIFSSTKVLLYTLTGDDTLNIDTYL